MAGMSFFATFPFMQPEESMAEPRDWAGTIVRQAWQVSKEADAHAALL